MQQAIAINKNNQGTDYLVLYITADRNMQPMEAHLWKKVLTYTTAFTQTPMSQREASILYQSCFIPALAYLLPAMWLPDSFFEKVHRLSISTILNKMGFHCNLPRSLVFAPRAIGSIGLCNLQYKMEVQQVLILIRYLCAQTTLGKAIEILLCQYQLWAGLSKPSSKITGLASGSQIAGSHISTKP